jgi:integrase
MPSKFSKLTRANIRALEPGKAITEYGIKAERLASGDTRYSINVMVDGVRIHRVIGLDSHGVTRTQAEDFIAKARSDAKADRLDLPAKRKTALTFSSAAQRYIGRLKSDGGKNIAKKEQHLRDHVTPHFAAKRLDRVSDLDIERYKVARRRAGAKPGTINRELSTLSHVLSQSVAWGWIRAMPCRIKKEAEGQGRIVALSNDECRRLLEAAIADQDPDLWLFIRIGLGTSMRHREILNTRFDHLSPANRRLYVPVAKAGAREQPVPQSLVDLLEKERAMRDDPDGLIFPTRIKDREGPRGDFTSSFRRAVKRAGLDPKKVTPHTLRHTAITRLVQSGVDIATVKAISGHKTLSMVLRYTHVHGAHIDLAMEALNASSGGEAGASPWAHSV